MSESYLGGWVPTGAVESEWGGVGQRSLTVMQIRCLTPLVYNDIFDVFSDWQANIMTA